MTDAAGGRGARLSLVVHHTNAECEFAYDKHTEMVLPAANKGGWAVVNMRADWKPFFLTAADNGQSQNRLSAIFDIA